MKKIIITTLSVALVFGLFTITKSRLRTIQLSTPKNSSKILVTASFYPPYFFASQIGGEKIDAITITPAGSEPHDYEPTPQDIVRIEASKLLILNGGVEAWAQKIKDILKGMSTKVVDAADGLFSLTLTEGGATVTDPHVWLDPVLAQKEVATILTSLIETDPTNAAYYQKNGTDLTNNLKQLDSDYRSGLAHCRKKDIVTSHAAFGYLAKEYGLNQVAIAGLSPDQEPSPKDLVGVANLAKKNGIKYIFFEALISPKLSQTIAGEIGAQTLVLDPIEGISDDGLKQGKNYLTIMRDNLANLKIALECNK